MDPRVLCTWAEENHIASKQLKVEGKGNEITAIPRLPDLLVLKGCIVGIDASFFQIPPTMDTLALAV